MMQRKEGTTDAVPLRKSRGPHNMHYTTWNHPVAGSLKRCSNGAVQRFVSSHLCSCLLQHLSIMTTLNLNGATLAEEFGIPIYDSLISLILRSVLYGIFISVAIVAAASNFLIRNTAYASSHGHTILIGCISITVTMTVNVIAPLGYLLSYVSMIPELYSTSIILNLSLYYVAQFKMYQSSHYRTYDGKHWFSVPFRTIIYVYKHLVFEL
ncbi:hypothetical protein BDP27DRAFT_318845 [Rhodocollybia butyracea]|uniref:Uncharacterized protein n=1 Tax=Rhodocollybia butyracea TaxID=206335 RepID=A0A9P5UBP4_9AGAR|nr:hypothetical protein BDP27DRAFT_318845 [Rhodocollybia butyracea]